MKCVIFGAGQTGRGFIAPILIKNKIDITFVDKNKELIDRLNKKKEYCVKYFGKSDEIIIDNYCALHSEDSRLVHILEDADLIITSIFASNIKDVIPLLKKANVQNTPILCIENGVNVKKPLVDANVSTQISEGIIFCTSIGHEDLSVTSEFGIHIPIDVSCIQPLAINGFDMELQFKNLIQRKIYTYNFISAVIAYFGSYMGYKEYAQAANDPTIKQFNKTILSSLNPLIAKATNIDVSSQEQFSLQALKKFENYEIKDSITRNAQQASRKLGMNERLMSPLKFAIADSILLTPYLCVIGAAINYGIKYENLDAQVIIDDIKAYFPKEAIAQKIESIINKFKMGQSLAIILSQ